MTRYFLNLRNGPDTIPDPEGKDYASLADARAEAISSARDMVAEMVKDGRIVDGQVFEICDQTGTVLDSVEVKSVIRLD